MDKVFETVPIQKSYFTQHATEWAKANGQINESSFDESLDN